MRRPIQCLMALALLLGTALKVRSGEPEFLVERFTHTAPNGSVAQDYDLSELVEMLGKRERRSREDAFDHVFDQVSTAWKLVTVKEPFTVVVTATPSGHEELTRALAAWKETGLDEFAIRVTLYSIPSARLEAVAGELSASDEPGHRTQDSAAADDRTMVPARIRILTRADADRVHRQARRDRQIECLWKERILACNGVPVRLDSLRDRLFTTSMVPLQGKLTAIRTVVPEGISGDFIVTDRGGDMLQLVAACQSQQITRVDTFTHPNLPLPLEQPRVEARRLRLSRAVRVGDTLAIGGLSVQSATDDPSAVLIMVRVAPVAVQE